MANPIDPPSGGYFRSELDDGQVVEIDGSTILDPATGADLPGVLLRMSRTRAHALSHVLDDWAQIALVFATLRSSEPTERTLAWTLNAAAAAAGDPEAMRCASRVPGMPSPQQRVAAATVLRDREQRITAIQRIAIVDAAARWLTEDAGEELAQALLQAVCAQPITANFAYLALIEQPEAAQ
jgi:hypothetical protein